MTLQDRLTDIQLSRLEFLEDVKVNFERALHELQGFWSYDMFGGVTYYGYSLPKEFSIMADNLHYFENETPFDYEITPSGKVVGLYGDYDTLGKEEVPLIDNPSEYIKGFKEEVEKIIDCVNKVGMATPTEDILKKARYEQYLQLKEEFGDVE